MSYSPDLRIELIATGAQVGTWGITTNTNLGTIIEDAISGYVTVSVTSANQAFTVSDGAVDEARNAMIRLTTTTTAAFSVYAPPSSKQYIVWNNSGYTATIYNSTVRGNTTAAGTGVAIADGDRVVVFTNGTNFYAVSAANVTGTVAVVNGGTGASTASGARTNLGLAIGADVPSPTGTGASGNWNINAAGLSATLAVASGGTNSTATPTAGGVSYGTGSAYAFTPAGTLGQVLTSNGAGAPTWSSVAANVASISFGTTGLTPSTATTGAVTVAGTLNVANGGTGATTAQGAMNTFAGAVTSGQYLRGNGANVVMSAIQVADVPTLNQNTTGNAATATKLSTTNFTIEESGGNLIFKYGGTTIASLTSAGVFTALNNVVGGGTP